MLLGQTLHSLVALPLLVAGEAQPLVLMQQLTQQPVMAEMAGQVVAAQVVALLVDILAVLALRVKDMLAVVFKHPLQIMALEEVEVRRVLAVQQQILLEVTVVQQLARTQLGHLQRPLVSVALMQVVVVAELIVAARRGLAVVVAQLLVKQTELR